MGGVVVVVSLICVDEGARVARDVLDKGRWVSDP